MTANVTCNFDPESSQLTFARRWRQWTDFILFILFRSRHQSRSYLTKNSVCPKRTCLHHKPDTDLLRKEGWFSRRSCASRNRILSCRLLHLSWQKSGLKVMASSFDLLAVLPRSQLGKTALEKSFKRPVAHRSKKTRSITWVSLKTNIYRVQLITSIFTEWAL